MPEPNPKVLALKLYRAANVLEKRADHVLRSKLDLTFAHFLLLSSIDSHPEACQRTLAHLHGATEASVSRHIDLLKDRGLLERTEQAANRRQHCLTLTRQGRTLLTRAKSLVNKTLSTTFGALTTADQDQMNEQLDTLLTALHNPNNLE